MNEQKANQSDRSSLPSPWSVPCDIVVQALDVDTSRGLTSDEVTARRERYGANALRAAPRVHPLLQFLQQFQNPLVYLLVAAVIVSLVAWWFEGAHGFPIEALAVSAIIVVNSVIGFAQELKAEQAVAALQKLTTVGVTVLRNGHQERIPAEELVPGDVMVLAEGDAVGADARLFKSTNLKIAEAALTGESVPVFKETDALPHEAPLGDRTNMVFKGTSVVAGVGRAVVTTTGLETEIGHIAHLLEQTKEEPSPLEREIERVGKALSIGVVALALLVVATIVLTTHPQAASDYVGILLLGVSLAVAAVPEGLPAVLSVVLAIGVQRMARQQAIVKKLSSVETLGSTSVICSDKTGTLTRNEMTLQRIVTTSGSVEVTGIGYEPNGELQSNGQALSNDAHVCEVNWVLRAGSLANNAEFDHIDGEWRGQGDPTETALLVAAVKGGFGPEEQRTYHRLAEIPFDSDRKLMSCVVQHGSDGFVLFTKGAPDVLFERCTFHQEGNEVRPLSEGRREAVKSEIEELSLQALRPLGMAYKRLSAAPPAHASGDEDMERELVFLGVVGLLDPPRPEAARAVRKAAEAGVRTIMITGDHPLTATRIAEQLGITDATRAAVTGTELGRMNAGELKQAVNRTSVFSRVAPEHKLKIVRALQEQGEIVAMTGDGVNDAPALKAANIGIAMGITGTEVSKEAAKMILADDNFATIIGAVREGRLIFSNISNALRYLLSSNIGEVLTVLIGVLAAPLLGLTTSTGQTIAPLLATQILWINLLTDAAPALALGVDKGIDDLMARPPRAIGAHIIDRAMQIDVLISGLVMALATLFVLDWSLPSGLVDGAHSEVHARTCAFTVLVLAQLFNCLNARSERASAFSHLFSNLRIWGAIAVSVVLQIAVVTVPFLNVAFGTTPLTASDWLMCVAASSVTLWVAEVRKWWARRQSN